MFDGKMFLGVTGIPILKIAFVNKKLALAEPVPLTFANRITKSFTLLWLSAFVFLTTFKTAFFAIFLALRTDFFAGLVTFLIAFFTTFLLVFLATFFFNFCDIRYVF